jgi:hypothetical protein
MILPALNWKALPVVSLTASTIDAVINGIYNAFTSSVYLDGSARVTGSASAWTFARELSGSTIEATWGIPPTGSLNQRFILAGSSRTGLTPVIASPDTTYAQSTLLVSIAKNASNYTNWNAAAPFTTGSFFGYWRTWSTSSGTPQSVRCLESEEAIAVFVQNSTANSIYGCVAGAIIDPESTDTSIDSESDNRLYGLVTNGVIGVTNIDHTAISNAMFVHAGTANGNHAGVFVPYSGSIRPITKNNILGTSVIEELTTRSGRLIKFPLIFKYNSSPLNFVGRLREITMFRDATIGNTVTEGATTNGYLISESTSTTSNAILFSTGSN